MKFLIFGDAHLKEHAANRVDNIWETQSKKLKEVISLAQQHNVDAIIQTGDLFNSARSSIGLISNVANMLNTIDIPFLTVIGQHDMDMRRNENSPTKLLSLFGLCTILSETPFEVGDVVLWGNSVGSNFSQDDVVKNSSHYSTERKHILVVHEMIHPEELYPGDVTFTKPRTALNKYKFFDLIICGDYHGKFCQMGEPNFPYVGKRIILNPGAMTRQTRNDAKDIPSVCIWDSKNQSVVTWIELTAEDDPFKTLAVKNDVTADTLERIMTSIRNSKSSGISFVDVLQIAFDKEKVSARIRELIFGIFEGIKEEGKVQ